MKSIRTLLLACVFGLAGCAVAPSTPTSASSVLASSVPAQARAELAPTGTLRIAVYPGSPTSLVERAAPEQMRGVAVDLGRALAQRLGVPSTVQVYPRVAEVVAALQRGEADFTVTNSTAERARLVDFAPPLVDLELGVLVPASSRVTAVERMDQAGVVVGVSEGSSSQRTLGGRFTHAKLRPFANLEAARAALEAREIDAFATNKGVLFELADRVPGARLLDGRWGVEHLAPAIPHARAAGLAYLGGFAEEVRGNGELARATQRAGLRGTAAPSP